MVLHELKWKFTWFYISKIKHLHLHKCGGKVYTYMKWNKFQILIYTYTQGTIKGVKCQILSFEPW